MSSAALEHLLAIVPSLTPEQLRVLQDRVEEASAHSLGHPSPSDADERLQRRLLALGLVGEIKPPPRPSARAFIAIVLPGEPLSATVIRERG